MIKTNLKLKKNRLLDWLIYVEIFSIIYQSGSVPAAFSYHTITFQITRVLLLTIPLIIILIHCRSVNSKTIFIIASFQLIGLINLLIFPSGFVKFEYKFILFAIFLLCFETHIFEKYYFDKKFYNTLFIIISICLLFYILTGLFHLNIPYTTIPHHSEFKSYFGLYYAYSTKFIPRLSGYFWEPGAYEIYLNIELLLYFVLKKENILQLFVIILSITFCQSAMGYLICIIILAYKAVNSGWYQRNNDAKRKLTLAMILFASTLLAYVYYTKKIETNAVGDSYYVRMLDLKASVDIIIKHPIFGVGYGNVSEFLKYNGVTKTGSSNGLLTWAYYTGLTGVFTVLFPFINNAIYSIKKKQNCDFALFTVIIILMNFSEPFYNLPFMVLIVAQMYYYMIHRYRQIC